jgi:hypothetical protein
VYGTLDLVRHDLETLAARHHVNDITVNTPLPSFDDRLLSYRLLADSFDFHNASRR